MHLHLYMQKITHFGHWYFCWESHPTSLDDPPLSPTPSLPSTHTDEASDASHRGCWWAATLWWMASGFDWMRHSRRANPTTQKDTFDQNQTWYWLFIYMKSQSASLKGLWADERMHVGRGWSFLPKELMFLVNVADCIGTLHPIQKDATFRSFQNTI